MSRARRCLCGAVLAVARTGRPKRYCSVRCRMVAYRRRRREPRGHKWAVIYSSKSCEWSTPPDLFRRLNARYGPFDLDPCATPENATCARFYTAEEDGGRVRQGLDNALRLCLRFLSCL
jgi:ribosomal protein L24E